MVGSRRFGIAGRRRGLWIDLSGDGSHHRPHNGDSGWVRSFWDFCGSRVPCGCDVFGVRREIGAGRLEEKEFAGCIEDRRHRRKLRPAGRGCGVSLVMRRARLKPENRLLSHNHFSRTIKSQPRRRPVKTQVGPYGAFKLNVKMRPCFNGCGESHRVVHNCVGQVLVRGTQAGAAIDAPTL